MIKLKNLLKENQEINPVPTYVDELEPGMYQFTVKTRFNGDIDIDTLDDVEVTEQDIEDSRNEAQGVRAQIYRWLSDKYDGFGQMIQLRSAIKKS